MQTLIVTLIAGGFTIVVALINRADKTSRTEHADTHAALGRIEQKIDGHINNHD